MSASAPDWEKVWFLISCLDRRAPAAIQKAVLPVQKYWDSEEKKTDLGLRSGYLCLVYSSNLLLLEIYAFVYPSLRSQSPTDFANSVL